LKKSLDVAGGYIYSLSPMKCFSKSSVIQSHCAKMREGICTQAKLHAVHLQKQDIVQNIKQRKDTTTVLWV